MILVLLSLELETCLALLDNAVCAVTEAGS